MTSLGLSAECSRDSTKLRAVRQRTGKVYPCLSPCDRCKNPGGVMVGLAENVQACLRIFRRTQHQWLVRDILHQPQGVFIVYVLCPTEGTEDRLMSWHMLYLEALLCTILPHPALTHCSHFAYFCLLFEFSKCSQNRSKSTEVDLARIWAMSKIAQNDHDLSR